MFFKVTNPTTYVVGGSSVVGTSLLDQTKYIVGNTIPQKSQVAGLSLSNEPRFPACYIEPDSLHRFMVDEWKGTIRNKPIDFTFNEDLTGSSQGEAFGYEVVQTDEATSIEVTFNQSGRQSTYRVVSLCPTSITLYTTEYKQLIKLYRQ